MTYQDEAVEVRRTSVGTKVLIFACALLAVLGSFWSIVWFIRAYVEAPRVGIPQAIALAARDPIPVVPPAATATPAPLVSADTRPANVLPAPAAAQSAAETAPAPKAAREAEQPSASITDRWLPAAPAPVQPVEQSAPVQTAPAELGCGSRSRAAADEEVTESSVPAIAGPAPLPRRKPTQTALAKRTDPPLPRPRPDGPAPQSVFTSVPVGDDRFPTQ